MSKDDKATRWRDTVVNLSARGLLGLAGVLPYRIRLALVGRVFSGIVAPIAGWRRRIRENLAHAMPELPPEKVEEIVSTVSRNVGRTLIEIYSGNEFVVRAMEAPLEGPGVAALETARAGGEPIVLVTAHLGNYDVVRGKLSRSGYPMGALYRPMANPGFNRHYVDAISKIAAPVYPTDRTGIAGLVRHLKDGGIIGIVADVGSRKAPLLEFFGKPAHTPVSAAEWALKYGARMIPVFGLRQPDGVTFRIHVADPIPPGTPEEMMQRYNDTVEEIVRRDPGQWFWVHRRWKGTQN
jgi:KDO2-lipid IV(A) lauroyltransferase